MALSNIFEAGRPNGMDVLICNKLRSVKPHLGYCSVTHLNRDAVILTLGPMPISGQCQQTIDIIINSCLNTSVIATCFFCFSRLWYYRQASWTGQQFAESTYSAVRKCYFSSIHGWPSEWLMIIVCWTLGVINRPLCSVSLYTSLCRRYYTQTYHLTQKKVTDHQLNRIVNY